MKKRLLLTISTICSVIVLAISIFSYSYAWLKQDPRYQFTLSTGDYPLIVKTNGYISNFVSNINESNSSDYEYKENSLRLERSNFKTYRYNAEERKDIIDVNTGSTYTASKGELTIKFNSMNNNIIDKAVSDLSIIGNSNNGYALNNRYFYVAFLEFIFIKQYFDAYLICKPSVNKNTDNMFKFSFIDSDQVNGGYTLDQLSSQFLSIDENEIVKVHSSSSDSDEQLFSATTTSLHAIYDANTNKARQISSLSRSDENGVCYSYACIYGIYIDPTVYFDQVKKGNKNVLSNTNLELTFDFLLCDSDINYTEN